MHLIGKERTISKEWCQLLWIGNILGSKFARCAMAIKRPVYYGEQFTFVLHDNLASPALVMQACIRTFTLQSVMRRKHPCAG